MFAEVLLRLVTVPDVKVTLEPVSVVMLALPTLTLPPEMLTLLAS